MTETILVPLHPFNASFFKDNLGKPVPERCETSVDLNEAEMMGFFGTAVASAGQCANNLHLSLDR